MTQYITGCVRWLLYNKFSQNPDIQNFSIGRSCLELPTSTLFDSKKNLTTRQKLCRKITKFGLKAVGIGMMGFSAYSFMQNPIQMDLNDIPVTNSYDPEFVQCHKKENPNILLLTAPSSADHNEALNPKSFRSIYWCLCKVGNLIKKVIFHPEQICTAISETAKNTTIDALVINAHGSPSGVLINPYYEFRVFDFLASNCFEGLSDKANIFLASCSVGKSEFLKPNIAEWISWLSGKTVISPFADIYRHLCDLKNGTLEVRFGNTDQRTNGFMDLTKHTNVQQTAYQLFRFGINMFFPTFFSFLTIWNAARVGAWSFENIGTLGEEATKYAAHHLKKIAPLLPPRLGSKIYDTSKCFFKIIHRLGRNLNQTMDIIRKRVFILP